MENIKNKLHEPTDNKVMIQFAKRFGISPMQIISQDKCSHISDIRHLYCKLRYECHDLTYAEIGHEISRSITAVYYGVNRINDLLRAKNKKIVTMWKRVKNIGDLYTNSPSVSSTPLRAGGSSKPWDERSPTRVNLQPARYDLQSACRVKQNKISQDETARADL